MLRKLAIALIALLVLAFAGIIVGGIYVTLPQRVPPPPRVYPSAPSTLRTLPQGKVLGFKHPAGSHAWLGIPYAAPPVGELRWRAPSPAPNWTGTREGVRFGAFCTQYSSSLTGAAVDASESHPVGSEDCLYLNVWAPALDAEALRTGKHALPVMVWLHGGGNSVGHGGNVDGGWLARKHHVVVVSINYRLGPFGWFRHPALTGRPNPRADAAEAQTARADAGLPIADAGLPEGDTAVVTAPPTSNVMTPEEESGNFATLDMIQALRWVRDDIRAFGGDPGNVTLFGESAGASNTLALMVSPLARGLFHRAIVESGGLRRSPTTAADHYLDDAAPGAKHGGREIVNELLVADGKARDRSAAKEIQDAMTSADVARYLRAKPAVDILAVYDAGFSGMLDLPLQFADGHVLPAEPAHTPGLFADVARFQAVPVILGTNRDEEKLFMVRNPEHVEQRFGVFPRFKDEPSYMRFAAYMSDAWKVRGADDLARAMTAAGHAPVYVYRFDWDEESEVLGFDLAKALGAAHGIEIAFVFGNFAGPLGAAYLYDESRIAARDALSASMMSYWAEFAHAGAPGRGRGAKLPLWQAWGTDGQHTLVFDTPQGGGIRMTPDRLSYADLKTRLLEDVTFGDRKARCAMYVRLFREVPSVWDDAEYAELGDGGCKDVDPADVPQR